MTWKVIRQAAPTANGNQTISGIGFTPTGVIVLANHAITNQVIVADRITSIGFSDGTSQYSNGFWSDNGLGTTNVEVFTSLTRVLAIDPLGTGADAAELNAVGAGLGPSSGQWIFNWVDAPPAAWLITYVFTDMSCHVGNRQLGTDTNEKTCTTTGINPDTVFLSTVGRSTTGRDAAGNRWGFGCASNRSGARVQRSVGINDRDNQDVSQASCLMSTNYGIVSVAPSALTWGGDVTTFGTGSFGITPTSNTSNSYVGWLALNSGTLGVHIGTQTLPTSGGNWPVTSPGFTPQVALMFGGLQVSGNLNSVQSAGDASETAWAGFSDGSSSGSHTASSDDAADTSDTASTSAAKFAYVTDALDAVMYDIPTPTFDSQGWDVTPVTASTTSHVAFILAIEAAGGAGVTVTPAGVASAGSPGAVTTTGAAQFALSGVSSASAIGVLQALGGSTVTLTGLSSSGAAGTLALTGAALVIPASVVTTGGVGVVTVDVAGGAQVTLVGVDSPGAIGQLAVSGAAAVGITGVVGSGQVGTLSIAGEAVLQLAGVGAAGQVGAVTIDEGVGGVTVSLTGVTVTGGAGAVAIQGGATLLLQGIAVSGQAGTITIAIPTGTTPANRTVIIEADGRRLIITGG